MLAAVVALEGDARRRVRVAGHLAVLAVGAAAGGAGAAAPPPVAAGAAAAGASPAAAGRAVGGVGDARSAGPAGDRAGAAVAGAGGRPTALSSGTFDGTRTDMSEQHQGEHGEGSVAAQEPLPDGEVGRGGLADVVGRWSLPWVSGLQGDLSLGAPHLAAVALGGDERA